MYSFFLKTAVIMFPPPEVNGWKGDILGFVTDWCFLPDDISCRKGQIITKFGGRVE